MYSVVLMMAVTTGAETPDCFRSRGCHGGQGYSGCHGRNWGGCHGSYGGCYGGYSPYGCHGCTGTMVAPKKEPIKEMPKPKDKEEAMGPAPATIFVSLPAEANLTVDGVATRSTSSERVFQSPVLPPNRDFHYTLRVEMTRDGKPVFIEKQVPVRAGQESRVEFNMAEAVASR